MSHKELLEAISQQARLQTDKILAEAEESANNIFSKAESEITKIKQKIIDQARTSMNSEEAKTINEARLHSKKEMLVAKHELVDKVMSGLNERLANLHQRKDYDEIFGRLVGESLEGLKVPVIIKCRPIDKELVKKAAQRAGVEAELEETDFPLGGINVIWGNSQFFRKNNFESRLEKIKPLLLSEVNKLLFQDQGG